MTDRTIDLDEHRGMAAQKATELRRLRDEFRALYQDEPFRELYPTRGQPDLAPWRLAR